MTILSLSDLLLSGTMIINALSIIDVTPSPPSSSSSSSSSSTDNDTLLPTQMEEGKSDSESLGIGNGASASVSTSFYINRLKMLLREFQTFRIVVAFWNLLMLVLMVVLFR
uniref:Uncharacterized protein n=1 Tax=Percolomonas cosmopolitus TaxID=63605 RepID=A0A7S1PGL9_9EUKA|mmetsp:Transcript_2418/g.9094  ORF Transcript_2418/g.9094 Transcript_2418/m.9094 type:complete len:111 (+) Transcript_2418:1747-2079(+)